MEKNFRTHHILQALKEYETQGLPLDLFLNHYFRTHKALGSKDRAFMAETTYNLIRWKGLIDANLPSPPTWEKRLELVTHKTIDELKELPLLSGHEKVSFPEWLYTKLLKNFGEEKTNEICLNSNQQAPATIRANLSKISRDQLINSLDSFYEVKPTQISDQGIVFNRRINFFDIPSYREGFFEVQDEGSQLLADMVDPKPGEHVLDFCAGSGGKTLAFAYKMEGKGQIYLHDTRPKILMEAKKRLRRAGIQNSQFIAAKDPKLNKLKKKMHWVLVDAPCSGTGTFRRNPDMKWRLKEEDLAQYIETQRVIFEEALKYLAPTGKIIYGTCSLLPEENEMQAEYFMQKHGLKAVGDPLRLFPTPDGPDGFYGIMMCKDSSILVK